DSGFRKTEERATFEACMKQIYKDLDSAIQLLPPSFGDLSSQTDLPKQFTDDELGEYNRVFGNNGRQRMSGLIAMAIRAKASLLAASPAYQSPDNTTSWEDAANYAGEVLKLNGGVSGLAVNGETWYSNASVMNNIAGGSNPPEVLWRGDINSNTDLEKQNFPPTLFGQGRINPSENLVDAFPMQNGYPINDPKSNYNPDDPYSGRVPLFSKYIVVNGSTEGPQSSIINTASDGTTNDALNRVSTSTRTGYYMRKLLRMDVSVDPALTNSQLHYIPRIRYTEIYLDYAEAANEAWGPTGTGSFGFSAYDVIASIRKREGIDQPDEYLESVKGDKTAMRELIRNTRRIELCFEDFRFWDLRRWNEDLTDPAIGDKISGGKHNTFSVEDRKYKDYMRFGPIPKEEVLKFPTLIQNYGWN
ncbi:MAG: RagB/SusD family nutrient uptake outer membrane protein, partial [Candidatus Saccharimonadales bacterium]